MSCWTAIVLGFLGSLHCAGMCGPLALALPSTGRSTPAFLAGRLAYNFGRILTYSILGLISGLAGRTLALAGIQNGLSIALGVALLIGLVASRRLVAWMPIARLAQRVKSGMSLQLRRRSIASLATLGLLNGLLPCGLVYAAIIGATATAGAAAGAQYMALFGLGTVPMMLAIGISGRLVPPPLRLKLLKAAPVFVFLLATLLILRGMSVRIPLVCHDSSDSSCCPF